MATETKQYYFEVLRVEKGKKQDYKFVFGYEIGEFPLELNEEYYDLFKPGNKYLGIVRASGMPDFLG